MTDDGIVFHVKNLDEIKKALERKGTELQKAGVYALTQVAVAVRSQAAKNAMTGTHPRGEGHIPGTGPGPNRVTGNLIRSLTVKQPVKGFGGKYTTSVYPTAIYSRAVELGSPRWKSGVNYPYLKPAADNVRPIASRIFTANFLSKWKG